MKDHNYFRCSCCNEATKVEESDDLYYQQWEEGDDTTVGICKVCKVGITLCGFLTVKRYKEAKGL